MEETMNLIEDSMVDAVTMEKERPPDGEGGFLTSWREGAKFKAVITFDSSMQARVANKEGVTSLYTVTLPKSANLEYHDVFKRISDGKIFRVTSDSDDKETPKQASFSFRQVTAEEWRLPK